MLFYWTINAVPACKAKETGALRTHWLRRSWERNQHGGPTVQAWDSLTSCQHESRESAQKDAEKVLALFPKVRIEIVEG